MTDGQPLPQRGGAGLAEVASTLIAFCDGSGALTATVAIDQGDDLSAAVVTYDSRLGSLEVGEGAERRIVPDARSIAVDSPLGQLHLHSFPPFEVDRESGTVTGVLGGLDQQARSVVQLAALFGGRSLASAGFETLDSDPLEVGANAAGEVALSCGGIEFETPQGWPGI